MLWKVNLPLGWFKQIDWSSSWCPACFCHVQISNWKRVEQFRQWQTCESWSWWKAHGKVHQRLSIFFDAFVAKFCAGATCKSGGSIFDVRETLYLECARIFDQHQTFLRYLMEETNPSKRISRSPYIVDLPKSDSPFLGGQLNNNYIIYL